MSSVWMGGWNKSTHFYIGIDGQKVPEWLEMVTPDTAPLTFKGIVLVTQNGCDLNVRPFFHQQSLMYLDAHDGNYTIHGNPTSYGACVTNFDFAPIIPYWASVLVPALLFGIAAFFIARKAKSKRMQQRTG